MALVFRMFVRAEFGATPYGTSADRPLVIILRLIIVVGSVLILREWWKRGRSGNQTSEQRFCVGGDDGRRMNTITTPRERESP
jgi:hypothetical protein